MIQILPRNPGEDNIGSSDKRWNTGYFNNIDIQGNKAMMLVEHDEETATGEEPGIMKQLGLASGYLNTRLLFDTWGRIKITSTNPVQSVLVEITVNLKSGNTTIKSFTFENKLSPNYIMTLPFFISAIVDSSSSPLAVEINWTPSPDFTVLWQCQCLRAYMV